MRRRRFIEVVVVSVAWAQASAHTPYRQWAVYRRKHLLILTSKTDAPTFPLGERVAKVLAAHLPASKARVARAPHTKRIASLISSKQMDVAILSLGDAAELMTGRAPFADYGPVALRTIVGLGNYLLICRDDFPAYHAYLMAATLAANKDEFPVPLREGRGAVVPVHPGARAYFEGRPPPDPPKEDSQ